MVNELLDHELVVSTANPRHRRSQLISLTAAGSAAFAEVRTAELDQLQALAPEISLDQLRAATVVMEAVARDIRHNAVHPIADPHGADDHG